MEANYFIILYWFCNTSTWIHHGYTRVPHPETPPPPSPYHPSGSSQCTSPKHPVSCIKPRLGIRVLYDIIHVSMPFSQIIKIQKHVPFPVGSSWQLQILFSLSECPERFVLSSLEPLGDCLEICCSPVTLTALWAPWGDTASSAQLELLYLEQC